MAFGKSPFQKVALIKKVKDLYRARNLLFPQKIIMLETNYSESCEEELEELRKKVHGEEEHGRMRFAVKLIYLLQFQRKNPSMIHKIGIGWCSDGKSFISNSKILGNFLNIRANSVNTNFRLNMFQIVDCPINEFVAAFGNIPDITNWNKRVHSSFPWSVNTTPAEAAKIRPISSPKSGLVLVQALNSPSMIQQQALLQKMPKRDELNLSPLGAANRQLDFMPEITLSFIRNDTDQLLTVPKLVRGMNIERNERKAFLQAVTSSWMTHFGSVLSIPHDVLVDSFIPKGAESLPLYKQIYNNIDYFLCNKQGQSQIDTDVKFDEYLSFIARYGPHEQVYYNIRDLTVEESHSIFDDLSFGSFSQSDSKPSFKPWFHPMLDSRVAESFLKGQSSECWVVRHSKLTNVFSVHAKICYEGEFILTSTHIWYNPISQNPKGKFSVKMSEGVIKNASSWDEMLFDVMSLKEEDSLRLTVPSSKPETKTVGASILATRTIIPQPYFDQIEFI